MGGSSEVPGLAPLVRRVIEVRLRGRPADVEDLVQETLARVLAVEHRLDAASLAPYAVVTARNVASTFVRRQERERRHAPRLMERAQPEDPEGRALDEEDRRAMAAALGQLSPLERESLVAHELEGVKTAALAEEQQTTPGAVGVRLARARARLRVEYLVALRRAELPTSQCRPVLLALSTGDRRDQQTRRAGEHLVACPPCAALAETLVRRRRPLAGLWPLLALGRLWRWLKGAARAHPAQTAGAGVATGAAAVVVAVALWPSGPPPLVVEGRPPVPLSGARPMAPYAERAVQARGAEVRSVLPGGFWVGRSQTDRVWVDLHDQQVPARPRPGGHVDFTGKLVPNTTAALDAAGPPGSADRLQLERQGHHVDVSGPTLRVDP